MLLTDELEEEKSLPEKAPPVIVLAVIEFMFPLLEVIVDAVKAPLTVSVEAVAPPRFELVEVNVLVVVSPDTFTIDAFKESVVS